VKDQVFEEITKLQKCLDEALNEIFILKNAVAKGLVGGAAHTKIEELDSYDRVRSAKTLGNVLWDMEQYLEYLGISNEEAMVKVASQFLTKDAKMWWIGKVDQIAHGYAEDISTWEDEGSIANLLYPTR